MYRLVMRMRPTTRSGVARFGDVSSRLDHQTETYTEDVNSPTGVEQ